MSDPVLTNQICVSVSWVPLGKMLAFEEALFLPLVVAGLAHGAQAHGSHLETMRTNRPGNAKDGSRETWKEMGPLNKPIWNQATSKLLVI